MAVHEVRGLLLRVRRRRLWLGKACDSGMMGTKADTKEQPMKTHLISLAFVKMAIERSGWLVNTKAAAVSRPHRAMKGRGDELLHGACVVFALK